MSAAFSIIVADPEPKRCETKCSLLRDAGWEVDSALTEAMTHGHVEKGTIGLLILDTGILCDDGADLCRKIKQTNPHILVLHTTSKTCESSADGYLCEPIDSDVLVAACKSLLRLREAYAKLEERTEHLKLAQEAAGMAVVDWNLASNRAVWSDKLNYMFGIENTLTEGPVDLDAIMDRIHPDDRERITTTLLDLRRDGGTFDDDMRVTCTDGRLRWITVRGQVLRANRWSAPRMLGAVFDDTVNKKEEEADALQSALLNSCSDAVVGVDTESRLITWNDGATALFGYSAEEAIGKHAELLVPSDRLAERTDLLDRLRRGESVDQQTVRMRKNGRPIHVWLRASPITSPKGGLLGYSGIYRDMTGARHRQHHVHQLLRELAHRSKNLMAVIQAMARHSLASSPSPAEFVERFIDRLRSLSVSHDLLSNNDWRGAPVADLVRQQVSRQAELLGSRVQFEGPDLMLLPAAAQTIGMALHELSSNAATYGGLSVPGGDVCVRWWIRADSETGERFEMEWVEHGGPAVTPPVRQGFGHTVVGRLTGQALGGSSVLEYPAGGIRWKLEAPCPVVIRLPDEMDTDFAGSGQVTFA